MTTNQIKMPSTEINPTQQQQQPSTLNYNNNNTQQNESQSQTQLNNNNDNNNATSSDPQNATTNNETSASASASANSYGLYNYVASAVGSAYNYVAPLLPASTYENTDGIQQNNEKQNNQQQQPQPKPPQNGKNHYYSPKSKTPPNLNGTSSSQKKISQITSHSQSSIKYALDNGNDTDASYSDLPDVLDSIEKDGIDVPWTKKLTQPLPSTVQLRSITYKINGKKEKQTHKPIMFRLVHAQAFKTDLCLDNIAMHPSSWFNQNINLNDKTCFTIIVHLQVKSIKTSFITYHVLNNIKKYNENGTPLTSDESFNKVFDLILNTNDDSVRHNRMKLIPRVVSGPYPVKRVVENRPVLLGNKVSQKYVRGPNYFEIDSKVDESMVAASIIKLCHRFAKRIVVDMAWTIQGEEMDELPERILCGCTIHNMDFSKCKDMNHEMQNCQKLNYQNTNSNNDEVKQN